MVSRETSQRADHFLGRVDQHLEILGTAIARKGFLAGQIEAWQMLYQRFIDSGGESGPPDADATDYLLTIAGLSTRYEVERQRLEARI